MTTSAKIVADSISPDGVRLTTMELRYPRFIHAELLTHRAFSRNAASSRAIPVQRLIESVKQDTAMPVFWGKNQPGMQAKEECVERIRFHGKSWSREGLWLHAMDYAAEIAEAFAEAGYHKQIVNRLLEPFQGAYTVLVTATDWDNFFSLRLHPDAQPEMRALAQAMWELEDHTPRKVQKHSWHLPYITERDEDLLSGRIHYMRYVSAARCARISYKTHDGVLPPLEQDLELGLKLQTSRHLSPFEHQATPAAGRHANFQGWRQFRKEIET